MRKGVIVLGRLVVVMVVVGLFGGEVGGEEIFLSIERYFRNIIEYN